MAIDDIREKRLEKLKSIERLGINPYPGKAKRTHSIQEAISDFEKLCKDEKQVVLVGRIRSFRHHGKSSFLDIEDGTGRIQAYFKEDRIGESGYRFFLENFDIGDFIEVKGILFKTKKGEKTIRVDDLKMLAKSLLPLPEKWHGLKDIEERYRKRYLDLIFNYSIKQKFILRAEIIKAVRSFLDQEGFLEVETPVLQPIYGGASARPFKTHLNALDTDFYLRIAPELYLKRLLVGGFEKVYEIGRVFRNEGMDRFHNPDYTHLEFYWAYADYKDMMRLVEKMFIYLLKRVFKKTEIFYQGKKINFKIPWERVEFLSLLQRDTKINYDAVNRESLLRRAEKLGVQIKKRVSKAGVADEIYKKFCRPKIWQPTFIIHHPREKSPLAKTLDKSPEKIASLQLVVGGWELAWAYSELNNPIEQRRRFEEQEKSSKQGFEETQRMDEDFIEAMEYGMPPAAGFGMGIDRLVALLTNSHSLREVILFPTMRPKS